MFSIFCPLVSHSYVFIIEFVFFLFTYLSYVSFRGSEYQLKRVLKWFLYSYYLWSLGLVPKPKGEMEAKSIKTTEFRASNSTGMSTPDRTQWVSYQLRWGTDYHRRGAVVRHLYPLVLNSIEYTIVLLFVFHKKPIFTILWVYFQTHLYYYCNLFIGFTPHFNWIWLIKSRINSMLIPKYVFHYSLIISEKCIYFWVSFVFVYIFVWKGKSFFKNQIPNRIQTQRNWMKN